MDVIEELLTRGVVNIIPSKEELKKQLKSGRKLNAYLGIDPTAPRIHIGHTVPLRKLQKFVDLGHNVTFLIGDFTTLIGDTSDKNSERPILTKDEVRKNLKDYVRQASKIIDVTKINVRYNSSWLKKLTFEEIIKLTQHFSLGDFISRELIKERLKSGKRVRLDEALYPVMQGYDSYWMDTDIQIGAADQTFNMQAGRILQKDLRNKESFILVTDYLMGTDGKKMSKSQGNAIWVDDDPIQMYSKVMSIDDSLINQYLTLATNFDEKTIKDMSSKIMHSPMEAKKYLAYQIVMELHSQEDAKKAQQYFEETFQRQNPKFEQKVENMGTLVATIAKIAGSKTKAKRLILEHAVDVNNITVIDPSYQTKTGDKIKIGTKIFVQVN
jgi:tyrosyl-tRNA synthetase